MDLVNFLQSMSINEPVDSSTETLRSDIITINGLETDIVQRQYADVSFLAVTQYKKLGSLFKITIDRSDNGLSLDEPVYSVNSLFGRATAESEAAGRFIAEQLGIQNTLMLFICLQDYNVDTVRKLAEGLKGKWQK